MRERERSPLRRRPCSCGERDKTQLDSERETERGRERENKTFMKVKERFLHLCKQCLFIQQVIKINMYCKCYYCCCYYKTTKTIIKIIIIIIMNSIKANIYIYTLYCQKFWDACLHMNFNDIPFLIRRV